MVISDFKVTGPGPVTLKSEVVLPHVIISGSTIPSELR